MRLVVLTIVALLIVTLPAPTDARHGCVPSSSTPTAQVGDGSRNSASAYIAIDVPEPGDSFVPLPWVYVEANGRDGLQRRDEFKDDTCNGEIASDWLIF